MSDDAGEEPKTQITFGTEGIARLLWADLEAAQRAGPLTYEIVEAALVKAMITHVSERAREEQARKGRKPN